MQKNIGTFGLNESPHRLSDVKITLTDRGAVYRDGSYRVVVSIGADGIQHARQLPPKAVSQVGIMPSDALD